MKCDIYKPTKDALKNAQERLDCRVLFKKSEDNYEQYEEYIIDSYNKGKGLLERVEYVRKV